MTMKKKTAGETARCAWRETTRKGGVMIDPNGRVYHGTAQEVRDCALTPSRRDRLADGLRLWRRLAEEQGFSPEERDSMIRKERREAISLSSLDARAATMPVPMTEADFILLNAGARLTGQTFDEYWDGVVVGLLDAMLDEAEGQTGKREIPLTRHERAALDRLEGIEP